MMHPGYDGLRAYYGDLHNHCGISYGHGSLEDAYQNARAQLDFASVTAHAHWPDLPEADDRLAAVNAYHREGFERALACWPRVRELTEAVNDDGRFVSFLSFEWHSLRSGDHNVYYQGSEGEIIPAADLAEMRSHLRRLAEQGVAGLLIPHHIGYRRGYRGINWDEFTPELTPVVEIFSMHGCAESDDAPYPYLHTMGPRDHQGTMQHGLASGRVFGVIGSTDHHNAHPGSYGHGRLGLWARELTRAGIWEAIRARRTYALTGDKIEVAFSINGAPMGSVLPAAAERRIEVSVGGGAAIDYVEILHNNRAVHRWTAHQRPASDPAQPVKVCLELGWGEMGQDVDWHVELDVMGGQLRTVEPRFRGRAIVSPQASVDAASAFSSWRQTGERRVELTTRTWPNPTAATSATQGICLEIAGGDGARLRGRINGQPVDVGLDELRQGAHTGYLGGFLTPAYCFHRAIPATEYACQTSFIHEGTGAGRDWYYVRVRQKNGQWAWSSPIWVGGTVSHRS